MRILEVRERTVPIRSSIRNAYVDFSQMTCSVVAVIAEVDGGRRLTGYGFNSNGRYAQGGLLRERFIPRLLAATEQELADPIATRAALLHNEKPAGHGERSVAVGVLDMALWDLAAKAADEPLAAHVARRFGPGSRPATHVRAYAAGGYYDRDKGLDGLRDELRGYLDLGYTQVKLKVGGAPLAHDLERIEAAIAVAGAPDRVAVDANARFDPATAESFGRAIESLGLLWYEEPVDPLDYAAFATLTQTYLGPLATGENLFSRQDARNLLRHGGLRPDRDVLQMDPVLSYGLTEYLGMVEDAVAAGWPRHALVPHGGHLLNLHAAAGLGLDAIEAYPMVFRPFGGFGDGTPVRDGVVRVPDAPGLGLETDSGIRAVLAELD